MERKFIVTLEEVTGKRESKGSFLKRFLSAVSPLVSILVCFTHLLVFLYSLTGNGEQNYLTALLMAAFSLIASVMYSVPSVVLFIKSFHCGAYFGTLLAFAVAGITVLVLKVARNFVIGQWVYDNGTNIFSWLAVAVFYVARILEQRDEDRKDDAPQCNCDGKTDD